MVLLLSLRPARADKLQPAVEQADRDEAQRRLRVGRQLYERGDLADAERELLIGQELDPMPVFNYTLGQIERQLGRCNRAIDYYRAYLKTASASQRASTQVQINRCQEALAEKGLVYKPGVEGDDTRREPPSTVVTPPPADVTARPAAVVVAPVPAVSSAKPWFRDALGMSLAGGGAAVVVAGAVLTSVGNPGNARTTYEHLQEARDHRSLSSAGIALLCVGGVAVVAGAIRLALVSRRRAR